MKKLAERGTILAVCITPECMAVRARTEQQAQRMLKATSGQYFKTNIRIKTKLKINTSKSSIHGKIITATSPNVMLSAQRCGDGCWLGERDLQTEVTEKEKRIVDKTHGYSPGNAKTKFRLSFLNSFLTTTGTLNLQAAFREKNDFRAKVS